MSKKTDKNGPSAPETEREAAEKAVSASETERDPAENSAAADETERLKAELEAERARSDDFKRKWYSVSAEYDNYRKRTARESLQKYTDGRTDVVSKLFPVADNLERAIASCADEKTKQGIRMVTAAFEKILREEKIEVIDPVGQPFDAEKHEAVAAVEPGEGETSGTVKQVYLKGYEREGKVLRFAQVVVVK